MVGFLLGDVLPAAHVAALTATGGLLLVEVALRLLRIREILAADLLRPSSSRLRWSSSLPRFNDVTVR